MIGRTALRIPSGLTPSEHRRAAAMLQERGIDTLVAAVRGAAFGPTWDAGSDYDLDFLQYYPALRCLRLDLRVTSLSGIEVLADSLEEFTLAQPPGFPYRIKVDPVLALKNLKAFRSAWKGLKYQRLAELTGLESIGIPGGQERVDLAAALPKLRHFDLSFGSATSLRGIERLEHLETFSGLRVTRLADISPLTQNLGLRDIKFGSLRQVTGLPDLSAQPNLSIVRCLTMNGLIDLRGLRGSQVRELAFVGGRIPPEQFAGLADVLPRLERIMISLDRPHDTVAARHHIPPQLLVEGVSDLTHYYRESDRWEFVAFP
ncbi:MAG: hypothetical protein LBV34_08480 [Nocardiopsaceae bacterium]|jgi:hypothetical protein|nr:hypothetical protein [Nocardiopsaceae bacterium]